MIVLRDLCKTYLVNGRRKVVADHINAVFPSRSVVALLGRNGAGKSSLLRMIAGTMGADSGQIETDGVISWPVGFAGSFHRDLTGAQNVRFIARVYGVDSDALVASVRDFAELGQHYDLPVRTYSSGMRSRLAFGTSMGIAFDTYLVDEVTAVGDAAFRQKSEQVFTERMRDSGAIIVSHSVGQVKRLCDRAAVIENGRLHLYNDVEDGIRHHQEIMQVVKDKEPAKAAS